MLPAARLKRRPAALLLAGCCCLCLLFPPNAASTNRSSYNCRLSLSYAKRHSYKFVFSMSAHTIRNTNLLVRTRLCPSNARSLRDCIETFFKQYFVNVQVVQSLGIQRHHGYLKCFATKRSGQAIILIRLIGCACATATSDLHPDAAERTTTELSHARLSSSDNT